MVYLYNGISLVPVKKNDVLVDVTLWVNLDNMLSERSHSQNTTCSGTPFI